MRSVDPVGCGQKMPVGHALGHGEVADEGPEALRLPLPLYTFASIRRRAALRAAGPEQIRMLLDFRGRRIRKLMEKLGLMMRTRILVCVPPVLGTVLVCEGRASQSSISPL
jgi:hypothetical protein